MSQKDRSLRGPVLGDVWSVGTTDYKPFTLKGLTVHWRKNIDKNKIIHGNTVSRKSWRKKKAHEESFLRQTRNEISISGCGKNFCKKLLSI